MNVLVAGGGGREDALTWKIAQSPLVEQVYCIPGNPGMSRYAECVTVEGVDFDGLIAFAKDHAVELTVVGPEAPLSEGIVDRFEDAGLKIFGPRGAAAEIESSKSFAKSIMTRYGIPTAAYETFEEADAAKAYVQARGAPIVVKANGLAAGKGVTVAHSTDDALAAIDEAMVAGAFGAAGSTVVIEDFLVGEEASIFALTDGEHVLPLATSQDYKPVFDGDEGPNTGGMGAYSPAPVVTEALFAKIREEVLAPCIAGMAQEGRPYTGVLYAGLMIDGDDVRVVEFNCRFGDPETQVLMPRMASDLVPLLTACCDGTLNECTVDWRDDACVTVVMASGGYPGSYEKGKAITGIESAEMLDGVQVFHAGTRWENGSVATNGGRVLNVTATGKGIEEAIARAYEGVERIKFEGAIFRRDIGRRAIGRTVAG